MRLDSLCGSKIERAVAVEPLDSGVAAVFIREGDSVRRQEIPFSPFLLLANPALLNGLGGKFEIAHLEGSHPFAYLASFPDSFLYDKALKHLKSATGASSASPTAFRWTPMPISRNPMRSRASSGCRAMS